MVIILVGVSGSGKSTYAKSLKDGYKIVSADDYFIGYDGNYHFDPRELGQAHAQCLRRFAEAVREKRNCVVDNTNTTIEEIAPYYALARAYEHEVEIVFFHCPSVLAAKNNIHGVSQNTIDSMILRIDRMRIPRYWECKVSNQSY